MVQAIIQLARYLGVPPKIFSYFAVMAITVLLTIPVTFTVQSATQMKDTLDTVVVNQKRLEMSLTSIFENVGERLNTLEKNQHDFYKMYMQGEATQNTMILDIGSETNWLPIHKERVKSLEKTHKDFLLHHSEDSRVK